MISKHVPDTNAEAEIAEATKAAEEVLLRNVRSGRNELPRTAAWGYPEPYTRDIMICALGFGASENEELLFALKRTLASLAANQSSLGQIPGLADTAQDLGASDTTPLFLLGLAIYREMADEPNYLVDAAYRAFDWLAYQSPSGTEMVAQQPTSDWRDEQWVLGHGLYVNTLVHIALSHFGHNKRAEKLAAEINRPVFVSDDTLPRGPSGLLLPDSNCYALWSYKSYYSRRFDLLGNSLAMLSGIASASTSEAIIARVESATMEMNERKLLSDSLPPNLFPSIEASDSDWNERYTLYNLPGNYHNGGVWPFVCGFYVAALVAAGHDGLALEKLGHLTTLCKKRKNSALMFGFNEWISAADGKCRGEDWQLWSAAMYLYAAKCVQQKAPLYLQKKESSL